MSIDSALPSGNSGVAAADAGAGAASGRLRAGGGSPFWTPQRIGIGIALAYLPMLVIFGQLLWDRPHYQFFPMILPAAAFLVWTRLQESAYAGDAKPLNNLWVYGILGAAWVLLLASGWIWSPWLAAVSALLVLFGGSLWLGGLPLLRATLPGIVLLLIIVPPPQGRDETLIQDLRAGAVAWSSHVLDLRGILHIRNAEILEIANRQLLIEEACSGVHSLMSILAFSLFFALWSRRGVIHTILLVASAAALVLIGNVVRIVAGAVFADRLDIDILSGWPHELVGLILFVVCLALVMSMDQLLLFPGAVIDAIRRRNYFVGGTAVDPKAAVPNRPGSPIPPGQVRPIPSSSASASGSAVWPWSRLVPAHGGVIVGAFLLLGLGEAVRVGWEFQKQYRALGGLPSQVAKDHFTMPDELAGWTRLETEGKDVERPSLVGSQSRTWKFQRGDVTAFVSVDYPFRQWHDLQNCYRHTGWQFGVRTNHPENAAPDGDGAKPENIQYTMIPLNKNLLGKGLLLYGLVDHADRWLTPPAIAKTDAAEKGGSRMSRITKRILQAKPPFLIPPVYYQVQLFFPSFGDRPLGPQQIQPIQELYNAFAKEIARQIRPGGSDPAE